MSKLNEYQINFIIENYEKKGVVYCANELNINRSTISSLARRRNLKVNRGVVSKNMSKNTIDINDYKNVNKKDIAYILGLIWTDGHVTFANNKTKTPIIKHSCVYYDSINSNKVFSSLNWRKFKSNNIKSISKNEMIVNWISSRDLGNYLIDNNFRDKEKGTLIYENFKNLSSHFFRGLLDGDGSIIVSKQGEKYKQFAITFSSSVNQNWNFITRVLESKDIKYKIRKLRDKLGESSQLSIYESNSIYKFCKFIYHDSEGLRLERKYDKYSEFLEYKNKMKTLNFLDGSI